MNRIRRLVMLRHGQTEFNAGSRMQGQLDTSLSDLGRAQAVAAAEVLTVRRPLAIISSDLSRALETAVELADRSGLQVRPDVRLRETHLGDWQGRTHQEVDALAPGARQAWREDATLAPHGGESRIDVAARSRPLVTELVAGSGAGGMAGGQMRDLEGEKGGFSTDDITEMQQMKTGALIRSAVRMGALLGGASPDQFKALTLFGEEAGRAFQLADDILDLTVSSEAMGKATGKDHARQKPTLVSRIGLNAAYSHLGDRIHHAISALMMFGPEADTLRETARYFAERRK